MSKLSENYIAVNEGKMAKSEFLRQSRQAFPGYINQFTSYDDAIKIFRTRGLLSEEVVYQCPGDKYPLEQIEKGLRYELEEMGYYSTMLVPTPGDYKKAKMKAIENLEKDPLYYIKMDSCCCDKCKMTQSEAEDKKGEDYKQKKTEGHMTEVKPGQRKVKNLQESAYTEKRASFTEDDQISVQLVQALLQRVNPETGKKYTQAEARKKAAKMIKAHNKKQQVNEIGNTPGGQTKMGQLARRKAKAGDKEAEKEIDRRAFDAATAAAKGDVDTKNNLDFHYQRGRYFNLEESLKKAVCRILSEAATTNLAKLSDENASIQGIPAILNNLENVVTEIESFIIKEQTKIQGIFDSIGDIKNEDNIPVGYKFVQPIMNSLKQDLQPVLEKINLDNIQLPTAPESLGQEQGMETEPGVDMAAEPEEKQTVFAPRGEKPQPLAESKRRYTK